MLPTSVVVRQQHCVLPHVFSIYTTSKYTAIFKNRYSFRIFNFRNARLSRVIRIGAETYVQRCDSVNLKFFCCLFDQQVLFLQQTSLTYEVNPSATLSYCIPFWHALQKPPFANYLPTFSFIPIIIVIVLCLPGLDCT